MIEKNDAVATTSYVSVRYNLQHYITRCAELEQYDEIRKHLSNFKYLRAKITEVDPYSLIQDFEYLTGESFFDEVRTALEMAASVLGTDPAQLGGQLIGRVGERRIIQTAGLSSKVRQFIQGNLTSRLPLNKHQSHFGQHQELIKSILRYSEFTWFQPMFASLNPADSILVRRINSSSNNRFSDFVLLKDNRTCLALDSWNSSDHSRQLSYYDLKSGQAFFQTNLPIGAGVYKLHLSPDQSRLLIYDRDVLVWDLENRRLIDVIQQSSGYLTCLMYAPDGKNLVQSFLGGQLSIFNFSKNHTISIKAHEEEVKGFQISPDGKLVITGGKDRFVRLWDMATGQKLAEHRFHPHALIRIDVSIDGFWAKTVSDPQLLGTDRDDSTTLYWNLNNYAVSKKKPVKSFYQNDVTTHDKTVVLKPSYGAIQVYDAENQKLKYAFQAHARAISKIQITSDDQYLVSIADDQGMLVWAVKTIIRSPEKVQAYNRLLPHESVVSSTALTSDGKTGVVASWDGTVTIWNIDSQTVRYRLRQLAKKSNYVIAITPDDRVAIAGGDDGALCGWDLESGKPVCVLGYRPLPQPYRHQESIQTIALHPSPSVSLLASGSGNGLFGFVGSGRGELKLWDYYKSTHIADLYIGDEQIKRTLFSPDGRTCVFGTGFTLNTSENRCVLVIVDLENEKINKIKLDFKAVGDIVFSNDGRLLGVSEGGLLGQNDDEPIAVIFDTSNWQIIYKCFPKDASGYIESLKFTNDGALLLGGSKGMKGGIFGWDLVQTTGEELKPTLIYTGHIGDVTQINLTSDDRYLISTAEDQTIRLWDLKLVRELAVFQTDSQIQHFSLAADNRTILAGNANGRVHIFKLHI